MFPIAPSMTASSLFPFTVSTGPVPQQLPWCISTSFFLFLFFCRTSFTTKHRCCARVAFRHDSLLSSVPSSLAAHDNVLMPSHVQPLYPGTLSVISSLTLESLNSPVRLDNDNSRTLYVPIQ